jgi:hypothetical protein
MRKFSLVLSLVLVTLMTTATLVGCKDANDFEITGTTYTVLMLDENLTIDGGTDQLSYGGVISYLDGFSISFSIAIQLMADMTKQYQYLNSGGYDRYVYVLVDYVGSISERQVFKAGQKEDAILYTGIGFFPKQ